MFKTAFILPSSTVKDALKQLDKTGQKELLVTEKDDILCGIVSDGDIRRHILSGKSIEETLQHVYNPDPHYLLVSDVTPEVVKELFHLHKILLIPILDHHHRVVDCITWDSFFTGEKIRRYPLATIDIPVVIMAGGKGTRLEPFTKILPKPLIPVGDKTIIECIMDEFMKFGVNHFLLTLNFKGNMIKSYFESSETSCKLTYLWEKEFLGTAGSLKLAHSYIQDYVIVSNCDVIVRADYADVLQLHIAKNASLTVLASIQHHTIPYGVIEFENGGKVTGISEKPEYSLTINTGVYLINKTILNYIPDIFFNMTDLIDLLLKKGETVVMYPVNEKDFIDVGQWEEYQNATKLFTHCVE